MKKSIGKKTIVFPHPVFLIGSYDEQMKPNIMTASWSGICCSNPPSITVSIRKQRHSYNSILKQQAFTVNIPSESFVKEADFAGIFSGKDMDKFQACGLTPVKAEQVDAPYIKEFPMVLICKLIHTFEIGVHTQFIGEIIDVLVEENCLNEQNKPILEKIKPFIYDSSESAYYTVGKKIMQAYTTKAISKK